MKSEAVESAKDFAIRLWSKSLGGIGVWQELIESRDRAMKLEGVRIGIEAAALEMEYTGSNTASKIIRTLDPSLVLEEKEKKQ